MSANGSRFSCLSIEERIKLVWKIVISHTRLRKILTRIAECHQSSKDSVEPECLLIAAPAGAGKTTVANLYLAKSPSRVTDKGTVIPILYATLPVPTSVDGIIACLLRSLDYKIPEKRSTTVYQTYRLYDLLKIRGVEMIILDDVQHLIERDLRKVFNSVDWLKSLVIHTGIPMVLMGTLESDVILHANDQVARRFSRMMLEPFGWETEGQEKEFQRFLHHLDAMLPFDARSGLSSLEMAFRIHRATKGVVGDVMSLVRNATVLGLQDGVKRLTLHHLAKAYEELWGEVENSRMGKMCRNPFRADALELALKPPTVTPAVKMTNASVCIDPKWSSSLKSNIRTIDVVRTVVKVPTRQKRRPNARLRSGDSK